MLYDIYVRPVRAYCARRTVEDRIDDAVAEIFLVAWRRPLKNSRIIMTHK